VSDTSPTLSQVIRAAFEQRLASVRVGLPGEIVKFDKDTQTAQVKPLLADQIFDANGAAGSVALDDLQGVPVVFPGAAGFAQTWPVAPGDPCWLTFSDRSIDQWFERGGVVDPEDERHHDIADPIAFLGVRSKPGALPFFDVARAVWGNKDQNSPRIAADASAVHLGVAHEEQGTQDAVRGTLFLSNLETLLNTIDTAATTAGNSLSGGGLALSAGAPLNAIPIIGGALAAGPFGGAGVAITNAGAALLTIKAAILAFKAQHAQHLQPKVKTS
jgi:hypothetical protein